MQPGDIRRTYADISALREDLGYNPSTTVKEGVGRFVDWYREYYLV
jgi:UDP-glucuronate 4-epimerase